MADSKDFVAGADSNAKRSPRRIAFITRRTSAQVKAETEDQIQTFPEVLFRAAVAIMTLAVVLVWISLMFNAPLEGLADPSHTPNPPRHLGTSWDCRKCSTTFRLLSPACSCQAWW